MLLDDVKLQLGIVTDDPDVNRSIEMKIETAREYLIDAGAIIEDPVQNKIVTCIAIGVNDLLDRRVGVATFSPAFFILAKQICRG